MTTRKPKPKPAYSPLIEWPTEQLQVVPVTIEHNLPTGAAQPRQVDTELPLRSLPQGKLTHH
jgi:hypothetical protein